MKYCRFCGNELFDEAVLCPKCKNSVDSSFEPQKNEYKLIICRDSQFFVINPAIKINVDGRLASKIENDSNVEIILPRGVHSVEFVCSFRNTKIDVNMNRDVKLSINWNRATGHIDVYEIV
jgi:hypothetical protein